MNIEDLHSQEKFSMQTTGENYTHAVTASQGFPVLYFAGSFIFHFVRWLKHKPFFALKVLKFFSLLNAPEFFDL